MRHIIAICALLLTSSCATYTAIESTDVQSLAFAVTQPLADDLDIAARFAPVIISDAPFSSYNRVGAATAAYDHRGNERIYINTAHPVFYFQKRIFTTGRGTFTNLIYRVHFEGVPFSMIPFYLTAGKNVGIFIIITLNERQQPLLITSVHSCGCYLAFTPTQYMPEDALPADWNQAEQRVYGQRLPGLVQWQDNDLHPVILLEAGTHRIRDIQIKSFSQLSQSFDLMTTEIEGIDALKRLPLGESTTSFFALQGERQGYVKGSSKPWEFLLMSWWALDRYIGVDKDYGDASQTGTVFYTDLNPTRHQASDMWPFATFLHYWGWRL